MIIEISETKMAVLPFVTTVGWRMGICNFFLYFYLYLTYLTKKYVIM